LKLKDPAFYLSQPELKLQKTIPKTGSGQHRAEPTFQTSLTGAIPAFEGLPREDDAEKEDEDRSLLEMVREPNRHRRSDLLPQDFPQKSKITRRRSKAKASKDASEDASTSADASVPTSPAVLPPDRVPPSPAIPSPSVSVPPEQKLVTPAPVPPPGVDLHAAIMEMKAHQEMEFKDIKKKMLDMEIHFQSLANVVFAFRRDVLEVMDRLSRHPPPHCAPNSSSYMSFASSSMGEGRSSAFGSPQRTPGSSPLQ